MRKSIVAGTLALASIAGIGAGVTLSFPGLANAATESTTDTTTADATTAGRPDRGAIVTDALAELVTAGTITQAQADAVAAKLAEVMPARGGGGMRGGMRGASLETAATAIGITVDDLRTALVGGQSIAQVAEASGVAVETVTAALKAELQTRLAQAVTDGKLTQEEADAKLAEADARIQAKVDQVGLPEGRGGRGGHGRMGDADDSSTAPTDDAADASAAASA